MRSKKNETNRHQNATKVASATTSEGHPLYVKYAGWLLAGLAFLLYANTLGHGFVLDDDLVLRLHQYVPKGLGAAGDILLAPYREGCFGGCLYRPLPLILFALEWSIAPNSPFIHHFMNVVWYAATIYIVYNTVKTLLPSYPYWVPIIIGLLFVVHPVHTEVVANIKSRDEIMSLFFIVLSIRLFSNAVEKSANFAGYLPAGLAYLAALLSKESAVTALPIFVLVSWVFHGKSLKNALLIASWVIIPLAIFFLMRGTALRGLTAPAVSFMDNPIVAANSTAAFFGTAMAVIGKYLLLLFLPFTLSSDYTFNTFPITTLSAPMALISLALHLGLLGFAIWTLPKRNILAFCILAYFTTLSLYTHIPYQIGTLMGERLLFTPSLFWCIAIPILLYHIFGKIDDTGRWTGSVKAFNTIAILVSILFAGLTIIRNSDWKSNFTLFESDVQKQPNSVRLNDGYAEELYRSIIDKTNQLPADEIKIRKEKSEKHSLKSLSLAPESLSANLNIGNLRFLDKNYAAAAESYSKCLQIMPSYSYAKINLSNTYQAWAIQEGEKNNNPEKARSILLKWIELDDKKAEAWHLLGVSYGVQGNHIKAADAFQKAVQLDPTNTSYKENLNRALQAAGK